MDIYAYFFPRSTENNAYLELEKICKKARVEYLRVGNPSSPADIRFTLNSESPLSEQMKTIHRLVNKVSTGLEATISDPSQTNSRFIYVGFSRNSFGSSLSRKWDVVCSVLDYIENKGLNFVNQSKKIIDGPQKYIVKQSKKVIDVPRKYIGKKSRAVIYKQKKIMVRSRIVIRAKRKSLKDF